MTRSRRKNRRESVSFSWPSILPPGRVILSVLCAVVLGIIFVAWAGPQIGDLQALFIATIIGIAAILTVVVYSIGLPSGQNSKEWHATQYARWQTFTQIWGTAIVLAGLTIAWQQVQDARNVAFDAREHTEQGFNLDRFRWGLDQLQNDEPAVRLGAISALEEVGVNDQDHRRVLIPILATFVRTNSATPDAGIAVVDGDFPLRADVQAILVSEHALLSADGTPPASSTALLGCLDPKLRRNGVDFTGAHLQDANLSGLVLPGIWLEEADLSYARLSGADLSGACLKGTTLLGANLTAESTVGSIEEAVILQDADLQNANLSRVRLNGVDLGTANLDGTIFDGTDLTQVLGLTSDQLRRARISCATTLPQNFAENTTVEESPVSIWVLENCILPEQVFVPSGTPVPIVWIPYGQRGSVTCEVLGLATPIVLGSAPTISSIVPVEGRHPIHCQSALGSIATPAALVSSTTGNS